MSIKALKKLQYIFCFTVIFLSQNLYADLPQSLQAGQILSGSSGNLLQLSDIHSQIKAGDIVILGEQHGQLNVQAQQIELLNALRDAGFKVSVGMEFLNYTDQIQVDEYRKGLTNEQDFLQNIKWTGFSFDLYRYQILFPQQSLGEATIALNAPRTLTQKIAKTGIESLSEDEQKLMPPQFELGNQNYFNRFAETMKGHISDPQKIQKYFEAQSTWDDTMAWKTTEFTQYNDDSVFVIVVGEFHASYGGGLKDRILNRLSKMGLNKKVWTISQLNVKELDPAQLNQELLTHSEYGQRADFIWLSEF